MYIIRTVFWLSLLVFLLPIGEDAPEQAQQGSAPQNSLSAGDALGAAMSTVKDVAGLCERKPDVCDAGSAAWETFQRKARYGVNAIYQWANGEGAAPENQLVEPGEDRAAGMTDMTAAFQVADTTTPLHTGAVNPNAQVDVETETDRPNVDRSNSQNTLTIEDLIPEWSGPGRQTRA